MANNRNVNQQVFVGDADPTDFNKSSLRFPGELGSFYEKDGKLYQLVLLDSSTTAVVNGTPLVWVSIANFTVTADISDAIDGVGTNFPAGVAVDTITAGNYMFMQVRGAHATILTNGDDDIAAGAALHVSADGVVDSTAAGTAPTNIPLAVATAADVDANNTVAGLLIPPLSSNA